MFHTQTVIQVPSRTPTRLSEREAPTIVRTRRRDRSLSPVALDPYGRPLYEDHDRRTTRAPTVIEGFEPDREHRISSPRRPPRSHATTPIIPGITPPRSRIQEEDDAGVPHRRTISPGAITEAERDGHLVPSVSRTPPYGESQVATPSEARRRLPSRPESRAEYDRAAPRPEQIPAVEHDARAPVGEPPRAVPSRPISAEEVADSQVIAPTPGYRPPSEVVIPDEDRFAEAFNNAEDERRLRHQDAERLRDELAGQAEHRRDDEFHEHEEERQRIFEEGERRRNETAEATRQAIFEDGEERRDVAAEEGASMRASIIHSALEEVVSQREASLRSVVTEEREELRQSREACEAERAALIKTMEADHAHLQEAHEAQVKALEEELVMLRETTETQRIERERTETERIERQQMEIMERDAGLRDQLADITNMLNEKKAECERLQAINEERWAAKEERQTKKQEDFESLKGLVQRIADENEAARAQAAEEKEREGGKPGEVIFNIECPVPDFSLQVSRLSSRLCRNRMRNRLRYSTRWQMVRRCRNVDPADLNID